MEVVRSTANLLLSSRFAIYLLIGGVATVIDIGLFLILHEVMGVSAILSHSISVPISALYSFICNAVFNFKKTDKLLLRAASFSIVVFLGYLLGALFVYVFENWTGLGGSIGKIVSLPFVVVLQFVLNAKISFQD